MKLFWIFIFVGLTQPAFSQHVYPLSQLPVGLSVDSLNAIYKNALNDDPSQAVFQNDSVFVENYAAFLGDLAEHLKRDGVELKYKLNGFLMVYFHQTGQVAYFLYQLKASWPPEKLKLFESSVERFIQTNKLGMSADSSFRQCGSVTFPKNVE